MLISKFTMDVQSLLDSCLLPAVNNLNKYYMLTLAIAMQHACMHPLTRNL